MADEINKVTYEFLDKAGVQELAKGILNTVNTRINERIVTTISDQSDDVHIPSALAVFRAIANTKHMTTKTVTGDIDTLIPLENRSTTTIYFQRDDEEDKTWTMYLWNVPEEEGEEASWISLGTTEIDLSNYWSKDDTAEMKEALGINGLDTEVSNIKTTLEEKLNKDDVGAITEPDLTEILDDAMYTTDPFKEQFNLTINYVDKNDAPVHEAYAASVLSGTTYNVTSPTVENMIPDAEVKTGTMPKKDLTLKVIYSEKTQDSSSGSGTDDSGD